MKIAICICTYKRADLLERLLNILRDIQLGDLKRSDYRIIVVDNHPDGQVRGVCERVSGLLPVKLDMAEENRPGVSYARNKAVEKAFDWGADFIAFIDDDDLPQTNWLFYLIEKQRKTHADIVGGIFPPVVNPKWPDWLKKSPLFDEPQYKLKTKYGVPNNFGIGNSLINRRILEQMKAESSLFLSDSGEIRCEDADFFARAAKLGASFSQAEKSIIWRSYQEQRLTIGGLLKDAYRIGRTVSLLVEKYGTPAQLTRRKKKAVQRIFLGMPVAVLQLFSKVRLVRCLYQISKEIGVLSGSGLKNSPNPL